jgi:hypothetical protein
VQAETVQNLKNTQGKLCIHAATERAYKTWGGYQGLGAKETVFEKRVKLLLDNPLKLVNPSVQAAYNRVLMGGACTGHTMNNGRSCIICQGRHEDTVTRWTDCRVAKIWMNLLDMMPDNSNSMTPALRKMIFLGLTPDGDKPEVRFNAMCICYLMYTAHNIMRCGTTGLNFAIAREEDALDWAIQKLTTAAHGHGYMSKQLTGRGKFGHNIVGTLAKASKT